MYSFRRFNTGLNKLSLIVFSLFISLQTPANICQDLFFVSPVKTQQQTEITQKEIAFVYDAKKTSPFEVLKLIQQNLQEKLSRTSFSALPESFKFAIAYSREQNIHIVSDQLEYHEHQRLLNVLKSSEIHQLLAQIPYYLRNKYFEISVLHTAVASRVKMTYKFAKDISFPIESQFITGFAQTSTNKIRRYDPAIPLPDDRMKTALQNLNLIQETLATCGLASICKILAQRNILYNETKMLELTQSLGMRNLSEILGPNPGLELSQLVSLLSHLGQQLGFTVRQVSVKKPEDVTELKRLVQLAVEKGQIDLIMNFSSPVIGRPGGGHFSPIAGFNVRTSEILMSEVNSALNPSFWISADLLTQAMLPSETNPQGRGYIVIEWSGTRRL